MFTASGYTFLPTAREMEYLERSNYNTFFPFQNNHQIHWHLQSGKMLCAYEKSKQSESREMD